MYFEILTCTCITLIKHGNACTFVHVRIVNRLTCTCTCTCITLVKPGNTCTCMNVHVPNRSSSLKT